ncbi:hypothetical protein CFP66_29455 [Pseudonocardia sp. MH-G8]|nr:hypothetical protein CFP66_29455 [Pseudonocardia sp. MH-G8]
MIAWRAAPSPSPRVTGARGGPFGPTRADSRPPGAPYAALNGRVDTPDGAADASGTVQVTQDERANSVWHGTPRTE